MPGSYRSFPRAHKLLWLHAQPGKWFFFSQGMYLLSQQYTEAFTGLVQILAGHVKIFTRHVNFRKPDGHVNQIKPWQVSRNFSDFPKAKLLPENDQIHDFLPLNVSGFHITAQLLLLMLVLCLNRALPNGCCLEYFSGLFQSCRGGTHYMKVTTYAPPFRIRFFTSLENLYSFDPYILAKMRKMLYFDLYFSSKLGKMHSFDPHFFTLAAFQVDGRCWASLSETWPSNLPPPGFQYFNPF